MYLINNIHGVVTPECYLITKCDAISVWAAYNPFKVDAWSYTEHTAIERMRTGKKIKVGYVKRG